MQYFVQLAKVSVSRNTNRSTCKNMGFQNGYLNKIYSLTMATSFKS